MSVYLEGKLSFSEDEKHNSASVSCGIRICARACMSVDTCMHACVCPCMRVCLRLCVCVCVSVWVYVCLHTRGKKTNLCEHV